MKDEPRAISTADPSEAPARAGAPAWEWPEDAVHWLESLPRGSAKIGRFTVLERLAAGGMGVVFSAYDSQLDRKLAIKVLRDESTSATVRARIVREARAMAKLSHPNVAQVFEVGEHLGSTFIAMEFVSGTTLRRWQHERRRSWPEVLAVYVQAGRGLAAAHAQGLVHRDFKPDNAMVGQDGRVRVLDFGLVRAEEPRLPTDVDDHEAHHSEPDGDALATPLTKEGSVVGTPAYMAPEQLRGEAVDHRTDQFSLCVSLYEALYGERPYGGRSMLELSASMTMRSVRPPPKGTKVPAALRRVLLRGLAVEPHARWPSMTALLAELRKLVAPRGRRWAALGVTGGLVVLGAGLLTSRYLEVMQRCDGAAEQLAGIWDDAREQAVEDAISSTGLPYAADTWTWVDQRLDEYARAWVDEYTEVCEATSVRQEQSPEVMDLRMECLRQRKLALRETVSVLAEADAAKVEKAVAVVASLPGLSRCDDVETLRAELPPPEDPEVAREVEALREQLAESTVQHEAGAYDDALASADAVVVRAEALGYAPLLAEALARRASAYERKAELAKAETDAERAYGLGVEHGHDRAAIDAAYVLLRVGTEQAKHEAGLQWGKTALPLARGREGGPRDEARVIDAIGQLLTAQGKSDEALEHFARALAIKQEVYGPRHPEVAKSLNNMGYALWGQGKLEEALELHQRSLAIKQEVYGPRHPSIAASLVNIGLVLASQKKLDEALDYYRRALIIDQEAYGPRHPKVATTLNSINAVLFEQGKDEELIGNIELVLSIQREAYGPRHPEVAKTLHNLGMVLMTQGNAEAALEQHQHALAIRREVLGPRHPHVAESHSGIGVALSSLGKPEEALAHYQQALAIMQEVHGPRHSEVAPVLTGVGNMLLELGRLDEALDYHQRALAILEEAYGAEHRNVTTSLLSLGGLLFEQGKPEEALEPLRRSLAIFEAELGPRHPDLVYPLAKMAEIELSQGNLEAAREHAERAVSLSTLGSVSPFPLADARFVLARVLWADRAERPTARRLAEQAREDYVAIGEVEREMLAEVQTWLDEHPVK